MYLLQFTIPASGLLQLTSQGVEPLLSGPTFQEMTIQNNNASGSLRIGDSTVSSTRGIEISANGGIFQTRNPLSWNFLNQFYVYGASGATVDVLVIS